MRIWKEDSSRLEKLLPAIFLIPAIAVLWRALYRTCYYPGWDTLGPANGLYLLKTSPLIETINKTFWLSRNFQYWNHTNSIIYSLIPGALTAAFPWEFWGHITVLLLAVFTFWICGLGLQIKGSQWMWLALALGSSPALLSFSICGYPYISGALPHAMALCIIFHPSFKKNWWLSLLLGVLTIEISWHTYQLGKTIFVLFFLAAFFLDKTNYKNRLVHLILGTLSSALLFIGNKGAQADKLLNKANFDYSALLSDLGDILKTIIWEPGMDLPILPLLGLIGIFFLRKNRLLFGGILLVQWALVIILGFEGLHEIRSRRFLLVEFYNIVVLLVLAQQMSGNLSTKRWVKYGAYLISILLVSGCIWQFVDLFKFTSTPIRTRNRALPYTESSADYYINPQYIDAANSLTRMVNEGKKIILIYNFNTYQENTTDMVGILERIYLKLGHNDFKNGILVFSNRSERYSHVPILPLSEIEDTLNDLKSMNFKNSDENWLDDYYVFRHPGKTYQSFKLEADIIFQAINNNFSLIKLQKEIPPFSVYKMFPAGFNLEYLNKSRETTD